MTAAVGWVERHLQAVPRSLGRMDRMLGMVAPRQAQGPEQPPRKTAVANPTLINARFDAMFRAAFYQTRQCLWLGRRGHQADAPGMRIDVEALASRITDQGDPIPMRHLNRKRARRSPRNQYRHLQPRSLLEHL